MSDVFEEVEEGLRSDKANVLWKKYGWIAYAVGAVIVGIVATREFMVMQANTAQIERVEKFEQARLALADAEYSKAEELFSEIVTDGSDLAPLASHYLAQTRLEGGGDRAGAAEALAVNAASDDPFAKIAVLKGAYLAADTLTLAELQEKLAGPLQEEGAIGALALELVAAKAYEEGDFAKARENFSLLKVFPGAPPGVVSRAEAALAVVPAPLPADAESETDASVLDDTPAPANENPEEEAGQ